MFSCFTKVKANGKRFLFAALILVFMTAFLGGCQNDDPALSLNFDLLNDGLNGTWSYDNSDYPEYNYDIIINNSTRTITYTGSYEGDIAASHFGSTYGVVIIQYTKFASYGDPEPHDAHENVGKYGALFYIELTGTTVKMADAYNLDWSLALFTTYNMAIDAFTPYQDKESVYMPGGWSHISTLVKTE